VRELHGVMEPNFPERLKMSVLYPIPWVMKAVVHAFISFLPRATQDKFRLCSTPEELCTLTGLEPSALPAELSGGVDAAREAAQEAGVDMQALADATTVKE
jgi:hypothetical protein